MIKFYKKLIKVNENPIFPRYLVAGDTCYKYLVPDSIRKQEGAPKETDMRLFISFDDVGKSFVAVASTCFFGTMLPDWKTKLPGYAGT